MTNRGGAAEGGAWGTHSIPETSRGTGGCTTTTEACLFVYFQSYTSEMYTLGTLINLNCEMTIEILQGENVVNCQPRKTIWSVVLYWAASAISTLFVQTDFGGAEHVQDTPPVYGLYPTNSGAYNRNSTLPQCLEQYLSQHEAKTNTNLMRLVWNPTLINAKPRSAGSAHGDQQSYLRPGCVRQSAGFGPKKLCEPASDSTNLLLCCCARRVDGIRW